MIQNTDLQYIPSEWDYNPKLYDLYRENSDTIGYVKIDGTNVSFPVVQTERANDKGLKGQYYLRKDFYGSYSMYGTPFLDYRCDAQTEIQSKNLIVYGHNVYNDGQMFSDLIKYRQLKFYKEHPVVHFDTLYGDADWLVVGVILTNAYEKDGPVWDYNNFINGDENATKEFLNQVAKRTMIVTGVEYNTSDNFLTLSTCSYDFTDARVVIVARQVREGEDISGLDTSKAYYNSNPLMPDKWYQAVSEAQQSEADATFGDAEEIGSGIREAGIEILELPYKTVYTVGEKLDPYGLIITVYDDDGSFEDITYGFSVAPKGPFTEPGDYEIIVSYNNMETTFVIKVVADENSENSESAPESKPEEEVKVTDFKLVQKPKKLEYKKGEKLDLEGMILKVIKSDGKEDIFTDIKDNKDFTVVPKIDSVLGSVGKQTVKITYDKFSITFEIEVKASEVTGIEIIKKPKKLEYTVGETLDTTGLTIKVTRADGSTEELTDKFEVSPKGVLNNVGDVAVTVTYEGKTAIFNVKVKDVSSSVPESSAPSSESTSSAPENSSSDSSISEVIPETPASTTNNAANGSGKTYKNESPYYQQSLKDTVKVNGKTMSVYDAVCQIVAYEAGTGQPEEHVKAQAVASYTYLMNGGGNISAGTSTAKLDNQIKRCVAEVIGYAVLDDRNNNFILA
ncbi:MAG: bacterial Ig-like domain-containing protein, partial [Oscillospiraceae bacterium]|nr:bacterial Ig-like domain-containing protein [Oscillospiraceae bacterium]